MEILVGECSLLSNYVVQSSCVFGRSRTSFFSTTPRSVGEIDSLLQVSFDKCLVQFWLGAVTTRLSLDATQVTCRQTNAEFPESAQFLFVWVTSALEQHSSNT